MSPKKSIRKIELATPSEEMESRWILSITNADKFGFFRFKLSHTSMGNNW